MAARSREGDGPEATAVVMVNQAFTRQFPDTQLGKWIRVGGKDRQVVGIVENGPTINLREPDQPYLLSSVRTGARRGTDIFYQVAQRSRFAGGFSADRDSRFRPVVHVLTTLSMQQHMRDARSGEQLAAEVTGGLALIGLLLAAAGLFGVTLFRGSAANAGVRRPHGHGRDSR